jgi:AraC-like DNA-binding protein
MHYYREFIEISIPELPVRAVISDNQEGIITADAHLHTEIEMLRVLEGTITIHFSHESLTLNKGELILINSMVVHSTTTPDNTFTKIFVLQFNPSSLYNQPIISKYRFLLTFINQADCPYYLFSLIDNNPQKEIDELISKIILELTLKEITYEISIKSYLYRILSLLYRFNILLYKTPDILAEHHDLFIKLEPIFEYTESYYMEDISVTTLSDMTHFNYSYFCRLFKKATGNSYIEYLNYVRVTVAEELIRTTNLPIITILERTGFSSLSYFNRVFKRLKGISPAVYRKHMKDFL